MAVAGSTRNFLPVALIFAADANTVSRALG